MKNSVLLLKTLLLSTSRINIFRHSTDIKKRRKIIRSIIGLIFIYLMLMAYSIALCIGYGQLGMIASVPMTCGLSVSLLSFIFTLFQTNGYLFNFKEYDMLMSLPFEAKIVAGCKFMYMYIKSLPWHLSISLAMMGAYGYFAHPSIILYPIWIILSLFLPLIPMLISAFLGFLIARVSAGFRKSNVIQTILTFAFVIFCFSLRFIIEDLFRNDKVQATLDTLSNMTANAGRIYPPAGWFSNAVTKFSIPDFLLLIGVSAALFTILFTIVGHSYRNINSALKSHAAAKNYQMKRQKQRSVTRAIAFKEFKRMTGSTTYMVNGAMGPILAILLGLVTLIFGFDKIIAVITQNAPFDAAIVRPAIPLIVYFCIGMVATTAITPSLEGKNYWIIRSLPIENKTVYHGKMLFNLILMLPAAVFSVLCLCISARVPLLDSLLDLLLITILTVFSTAWGCVCGIRHMKLDWENEVEVIKQSSALAIYMFPNMIAVILLIGVMVYFGTIVDQRLLTLIMILPAFLLAVLSYRRAMILACKNP